MKNNSFTRRELIKLMQLLPLASLLPARAAAPSSSSSDQPNILIFLFDTLTTRHMSLHGYQRPTTPNIARFAQRATVFHRHYAPANFTTPGTVSLLTGSYPWQHRGLHLFGQAADEFANRSIFNLLPPEYTSLTFTHNLAAQLVLDQFHSAIDQFTPLEEAGFYYTYLLAPNSQRDLLPASWAERMLRGDTRFFNTSFFLSTITNLIQDLSQRQRFMESLDQFPRGLPSNGEGLFFLLEDSIDWSIAQIAALPRPHFGYFHYFPPHFPSNPPGQHIDIFDPDLPIPAKPPHIFTQGRTEENILARRLLYDENVAYIDSEFGRLIDSLEAQGVLEDSYVIFTADHGELFERGIQGHETPVLYDPLLHIPLLISKPGQRDRVDVHTPTSAIDLLPTILHLTGQPSPPWAEGRVLPTFSVAPPDENRPIFALEAKTNQQTSPLITFTAAVTYSGYKLIQYQGYPELQTGFELYDLENDPEELNDLYPTSPSIAAQLQLILSEKLEENRKNAP